jgi:peptide/nickel transport system permease protein
MMTVRVEPASGGQGGAKAGRWLVGGRIGPTIAVVYLLCLASLAVLAPSLSPYSPTDQDYDFLLSPPNATHLLGTDDLGRDVLSRLLHGAPISLGASVLAVFVALVLGLPVGIVAGFFGGTVDQVLGRMIDTVSSFPGILLAIAVTSALGVGLANSMIAVGFVFSPEIARIARAQTMVVRSELYVEAASRMGASMARVLTRHILPNIIPPVIVQVTLLLPTALLVESSLSFLGLGIQPPFPSWGAMLSRAFSNIDVAPFLMYAPGLAIVATAVAFNSLGEAVRRRLNPVEIQS